MQGLGLWSQLYLIIVHSIMNHVLNYVFINQLCLIMLHSILNYVVIYVDISSHVPRNQNYSETLSKTKTLHDKTLVGLEQ